MTFGGSLLAWIEPSGSDAFVGAFVGEGALPDNEQGLPGRAPATYMCQSLQEAKRWIEEQAASFGLPVTWLSGKPGA